MGNLLKYLLLACLIVGLPAMARAADTKIGVVSAEEIMSSAESGKKALAGLKATFEAKQQDLKRQNDDFKRMEDDYRKKSVTLSADAKAKMQNELEVKARKMMEDQQGMAQKMDQEQARVMGPLLTILQQVVSDYAKKNGYSIMLDKRTLIYSAPAVDITADIAKEFEAAAKKGGK